jgi:hypothetical protein
LNSGPSYQRGLRNKTYVSLRKFQKNKLLRENEQICSVSLYVPNCTVQNLSREANSSSASKKKSAFHATRRYITLFTTAYPLSPCNPIQEFPSHFCKIHFNMSSHLRLGLASSLFSSGFPIQVLHRLLFSLFYVMS